MTVAQPDWVLLFEKILEERVRRLTAFNATDVHVDEVSSRLDPSSDLALSEAMFRWATTNMSKTLAGKVVMLMVPLENSRELDRVVPSWTALARQLSETPPSIYAMDATAYLLPDPAERYITSIVDSPMSDLAFTASYYQCWRRPNHSMEEGWARDVRVVSTALLQSHAP